MLAALVALAAGGLALSACGIPTQRTASPISTRGTHISLPHTQPTISPCTKSGCIPIDVYFVTAGGRLKPTGRVVPRDATLATIIHSLLSGPTTAEQALGIRTTLGTGIRLLSATVTAKKSATLDFNTHFFTLSGTQEVLGVAQVVYTVNSIMPGAGVTFEIEGGPIEVPVESGALATTIAVHESQYASLLTVTTPTTTTTP